MDIKEILGQVRRTERTVQICVRGDLLGEWDRLEAALEAADSAPRTSLADVDSSRAIAEAMEALRDEIREAQVTFRVRGLSDREFSDLLAAHPGRSARNEVWDMSTFPAALVAACVVDPQMDAEDAATLLDELPRPEALALFNAAYTACTATVDVPFSRRASEILRATAEK